MKKVLLSDYALQRCKSFANGNIYLVECIKLKTRYELRLFRPYYNNVHRYENFVLDDIWSLKYDRFNKSWSPYDLIGKFFEPVTIL